MNSKLIYQNLCESCKELKKQWGYGSGLHRHHITPKHSGGTDDESNFTYLTPREHIIAHYLLWRIYNHLKAEKNEPRWVENHIKAKGACIDPMTKHSEEFLLKTQTNTSIKDTYSVHHTHTTTRLP